VHCDFISWSSKLYIYNKKIHRDWKQCCGPALVSDFSADPAFYVNANCRSWSGFDYRNIKILVENKIIVSLFKTYIINIPRPPWRTCKLQGENLSDLRREHPELLQQSILNFFSFFVGKFFPSRSGSAFPVRIQIQFMAYSCRSRSTALLEKASSHIARSAEKSSSTNAIYYPMSSFS